MPYPLRGPGMNVLISGDAESMVADLQHIGFQANAFLHQVVTTAMKFVDEEENKLERLWNASLAIKPVPPDFFVCRPYRVEDLPEVSWLLIRRTTAGWILSGILSDISRVPPQ